MQDFCAYDTDSVCTTFTDYYLYGLNDAIIPASREYFVAIALMLSCNSDGMRRLMPHEVEGSSSMLCLYVLCCFNCQIM